MQEQILKFFNIELAEIEELVERLTRVGNTKAQLIFSDQFKLLNVLELYCREGEEWTDEDKFVAISYYLESEDNEYRISSLFLVPIKQDIYLKFRNIIAVNNIDQLKIQFQGKKYKDLLQAHASKMGLVKLEMAILGTIASFNPEEKKIARIILEEYIQIGKNNEFWCKGCDVVLSEICTEFKRLLSQNNYEPEDKIQFEMFQLITMYFASIILQDKVYKKHFFKTREDRIINNQMNSFKNSLLHKMTDNQPLIRSKQYLRVKLRRINQLLKKFKIPGDKKEG